MNILHVIANLAPRYGGPSKACEEMAQAVAARGHHVSIYTTNQDGAGELPVPLDEPVHRNGVQIHYFPIQTPRFWGYSRPMWRLLSATVRQFDVVHIHSLYLFHTWMASSLCRRNGIPYLLRPHGTLDPFLFERHRIRKRAMELLMNNRAICGAEAIHFTSELEQKLAQPYIFGRPGVVIPNGLWLAEYESLPPKETFRDGHPETKGKKIVLFLGRVNFKKGLDVLAEAFGRVVRKNPLAHLVIAGGEDTDLAPRLRAWLQNAGALQATTFTGLLTHQQKLAAFADSDVFVLSSYTENFGFAVIEAAACGLPVIISEHVNIMNEIKSAGAGVVVRNLPEPVADAILERLADPEGSRRMGDRGRQFVREHFDWRHIAEDLERVYERVRSRHRITA